MSQSQLAALIGVANNTVLRWENQARKASIDQGHARVLACLQKLIDMPEPARTRGMETVRSASFVSGLHGVQALLNLTL